MTESGNSRLRVALVGMGIIGKRLAHAIVRQPDMELSGIAVRSVNSSTRAQPHYGYYASSPAAMDAIRAAGVEPAGELGDLLAGSDVVVDAGTARSGATRADRYAAAGIGVLYCGGERSDELGPLIHPALNFAEASGVRSIRLPSCNTTALGRVVAAIGPSSIVDLEATVLRCATDSDKAAKGITNGATVGAGPSHHAADLRALVPGISAHSRAVALPMTCGHLILLGLRTEITAADAVHRLGQAARIRMAQPAEPLETARLRAAALAGGRPWGQRFELVVMRSLPDTAHPGKENELTVWLSLDNESITILEMLDMLRSRLPGETQSTARRKTDVFAAAGGGGSIVTDPAAGPRGNQLRHVPDTSENDVTPERKHQCVTTSSSKTPPCGMASKRPV